MSVTLIAPLSERHGVTGAGGHGDTGFDAQSYHRSVVGPLRAHPRQLPDDLRVRYALHDPLPDAMLAVHLETVTAYWTARRELPDHSQAVYAALLDAHAALLADPRVDLYSARWWAVYRPPEPATPRPDPPQAEQARPDPPQPDPLQTDHAQPVAAADPPAEPVPDTPAPSEGPHELIAERSGDVVSLSWIWPGWATEALVTWPGGHRAVDHETYLRAGSWTTTLTEDLADGEVAFCVAIRGVTSGRTAWSPAVCEKCPGPQIEVFYELRRLSRRGRRYAVDFRTARPPATAEIAIAFSPTDHLPWSTEGCEILDQAYLRYQATTVQVELPGPRRPGYVRCFVLNGPVTLIDPHPTTLRIR